MASNLFKIVNELGISIKDLDNVTKFMPILVIINDDNLSNKIKIFKFHKIPFTRLSQIKVLSLSSSELERRITISKSNNFFVNVMNNPLVLLESSRYSFKKKEKKCLELTPENILSLDNVSFPGDDAFVRYESLTGLASKLLRNIDFDILSKLKDIDNNIMKLVSLSTLSDEEILLKSLTFRTDLSAMEEDEIRNAINSVINNNEEIFLRAM